MTAEKTPRAAGTLVWLIVSQLIYLVSLFPWLAMALMSFMAFDAGVNWQNLLFVLAMWSYPLWLLLFAALAWLAYRRAHYKAALAWTSLPLPLLLAAAAIIFS